MNYLTNLNDSKLFAGITMLLLNLGSKYLVHELSETQEELLSNKILSIFSNLSAKIKLKIRFITTTTTIDIENNFMKKIFKPDFGFELLISFSFIGSLLL